MTSCGCHSERDPTPDSVETIVFCPTHEAAGEMEALLRDWMRQPMETHFMETYVLLDSLDRKGEK